MGVILLQVAAPEQADQGLVKVEGEIIQMPQWQFMCEKCGKHLSSQKSLDRHSKTHEIQSDHGVLVKPKETVRKCALRECDICGKMYARTALYAHRRCHTGEKPYKCKFCPQSFVWVSNMQRHERIHTGEKPFQCEECGKWFTRRDDLKLHQQIHTGEKPFVCKHCGHDFRRRSQLRKHERARHKICH